MTLPPHSWRANSYLVNRLSESSGNKIWPPLPPPAHMGNTAGCSLLIVDPPSSYPGPGQWYHHWMMILNGTIQCTIEYHWINDHWHNDTQWYHSRYIEYHWINDHWLNDTQWYLWVSLSQWYCNDTIDPMILQWYCNGSKKFLHQMSLVSVSQNYND